MALSKDMMEAEWIKRNARIEVMFHDGTDDKTIFEELCSPVFSGDEFENLPGIINRNDAELIDAACHIIIAECAISMTIDSTVIPVPDYNEILTAIFGQLKRDNIAFQAVYEAIDKCDVYKWFTSSNEKCTLIRAHVLGIWENARKYPLCK